MEDDIDIEEHDVLDNPRIKNIFPHLIEIKIEKPDNDYEGSLECPPDNNDEDSASYNPDEEYTRYNNKIILGSKPNSGKQAPQTSLVFGKDIKIKQEIDIEEIGIVDKNDANGENSHGNASSSNFGKSVLILGSKPNYVSNLSTVTHKEPSDVEDFESNFDDDDVSCNIKVSEVSLVDWGPILKNSPCFCKKCNILFPTSNTLHAHNMSVHSFLVALETNKAVKSTAKGNTAKKSVTAHSGKYCNHCNKIFPDSDTLISHLYKSLTFDKSKGLFKNKTDSKVVPNVSVGSFDAQKAPVNKIEENKEIKTAVNMMNTPIAFRCPICTCYFQRFTIYTNHVIRNHKCDPNNVENLIQEPFDGKCKFCSVVLSNQLYYTRHIKKFHSKMLHATEPKKLSGNGKQIKFRCMKCHAIFQSYTEARMHRQKSHPETRNQMIFKRITYQTNSASVNVQKVPVPGKVPVPKLIPKFKKEVDISSLQIPISVLYKCPTCYFHFTSCTACLVHSRHCTKIKGDWKCHICRRYFEISDRIKHTLQHKHSGKFDVYIVDDNIYGRILNQCPECEANLHEKDFKLHRQKECDGVSIKCKFCKLHIHSSSLDDHNYWHKKTNFEHKYMIIVKFAKNAVVQRPVALKRKLSDDEEAVVPKKSKEGGFHAKVTVYYCAKCKCCMTGLRHLQKHKTGACVTQKLIGIQHSICKLCGLLVTNKHLKLHETIKKLTIFDMKFIQIGDKMVINPPIPKFPKCNKCKTHFCSATSIRDHCCDDSHKTCGYCDEKFSDLAYSLHVKFHEYENRTSGTSKTEASKKITKPKLLKKESSGNVSNAIVMPELLKMYHMLNDAWNVLYKCETCDILCDNYDYAIDHCQKHFNNMESYDVIVKNCKICNLNFDSTCFEKHRELHIKNTKLNKYSFKIQTYDYTKLLTAEWLEIFDSLPQSQVTQIMSKSIYSLRSVKLRLANDVPSEYVLYKCGKCKKFEHPLSIAVHSCGKAKTAVICRHCPLKFTSQLAVLQHEGLHSKTMDFKLVLFNERGDEEFNETLWNQISKDQDRWIEDPVEKKKHKNATHYYKCNKCNSCIIQRAKAMIHNCDGGRSNVKCCEICKLHFHSNCIHIHVKLHTMYNFTKTDIILSGFSPRTIKTPFKFEEINNKVTLFKCRCGLHFTSLPNENHYKICGTSEEISTENCSKCGLVFDTAQLVTHLLKHHSNGQEADFNIVPVTPVNKPTIYKCKKCLVLFCKKIQCIQHACKKNITECSKCGLLFNSTLKHLLVHKNCSEMSEKDYNVVLITPKKYLDVTRCLFKCDKCDVYYMSSNGLRYHIEKNHALEKIVQCEKCNLSFMPLTRRKHMELHHKTLKCKRKDFQIFIGTLKHGKMIHLRSTLEDRNLKSDENDQPIQKKVFDSSSNICYFNQEKVNLKYYSNKLFKCLVCKVHYLTRGTLEWHRWQTTHCKMQVKCEQCRFDFSIQSIAKHKYVHHKMMKLDRGDFKIKTITRKGDKSILVDVSDFDELRDHMEVDNVSDDDDRTEEDENVSSKPTCSDKNKENKSVRKIANIENKNLEVYNFENILFKCKECNMHFVRESFRSTHIINFHEKMCKKTVRCSICHLVFPKLCYIAHKSMHTEKNVTLEDFYVIPYSIFGRSMVTDHLFQCHICLINYGRLELLHNHLQENLHENSKVQCDKCNLFFGSYYHLNNHLTLHHEHLKLDPQDYIVMRSTDKLKLQVIRMKYPQESFDIVDKVVDHDGDDDTLSSVENVSQTENIDVMDVDDENDDLSDQNDLVDICRTKKIARTKFFELFNCNLYKCSKCSVCFLKLRSFERHFSQCHYVGAVTRRNAGKVCPKCGLKMASHNLPTHVKIQHDRMHLKKEDFNIIDEIKISHLMFNTALDSYKLMKKVFRCHKCYLNFNTYLSLLKHALVCEHKGVSVKCDVCSLNYCSEESLKKHKNIYHEQLKLSVTDFEVYNVYLMKIGTSNDAKAKIRSETIIQEVEIQDVEPDSIIDKISTLNEDLYNSELYKCSICLVHFLTREHMDWHVQFSNHNVTKSSCTSCGLAFSINILPTHVYIHHEKLNLQTRDFYVITSDDTGRNIDPAPSCSTQVNNTKIDCLNNDDENDSNVTVVILGDVDNGISESNENIECQAEDSVNTRETNSGDDIAVTNMIEETIKEIDEKKEKETELHIEIADSSGASELTDQKTEQLDLSPKEDENIDKYKTKLYKCAACNVCFLTQSTCYKHTTKHVLLDPKDYIECKLCGYQFLIVNTLHSHMNKHHRSPLEPKDILIEEYHPDVLCHGSPKIKIYNGTDKVQSKLVSTTTEANVITNKELDRQGKVD